MVVHVDGIIPASVMVDVLVASAVSKAHVRLFVVLIALGALLFVLIWDILLKWDHGLLKLADLHILH